MAGNSPGPVQLQKKPQSGAINQAVGAIRDVRRNYSDMVEANTIGADAYFHCRANCEAASRGGVGRRVASELSAFREGYQYVTGDEPLNDAVADTRANVTGSRAPARSDFHDCEASCARFRPRALPERYRSSR